MNERIEKGLENDKLTGNSLRVFKNTGKALLVIDYTYDFVADDGALTCGKPAQDIEDEIVKVTIEAIERGDFVVFAVDCHKENDEFHPETKLCPPHNILGAKGRELYGKLNNVYLENSKNSNVYYMNKTRYSAFAGTDLDQQLRARNIHCIDLIGNCTDICDLHTAIDAYNLGYKIRVVKNAVASFDSVGHEYALKHMKNYLGAEIL